MPRMPQPGSHKQCLIEGTLKMNTLKFRAAVVYACAFTSLIAVTQSSADSDDVSKTLENYDKRLQLLEEHNDRMVTTGSTDTTFNPAFSIILDGVFASYKNDPDDYNLPGYALGGEAGLPPEGFSLGHSEIIFSSNIDDKFFGQLTLAVAEHDNTTEVELEEAFFETLALGGGFNLRGGRFYSAIGYLNQQHRHAWDFYDAPLVYRGLFGDQYYDDGLRLSFIAPTDIFWELGAEAFTGNKYPAGGEHNGVGSWTAFTSIGGDVGASHSWQAGLSYWSADDIEREYSGHTHAATAEEVPLFTGDGRILGANAVYKWAPDGNYRERNVKIQFEYFDRDETGDITLLNSIPLENSTLHSRQSGWYLQGTWQFMRHWQAGIRYDLLDSDNTGSDIGVLDEAGLVANGYRPERVSLMAEWIPSEFSRIRLQFNRDDSCQTPDDQLYLQYTFSMGSHGAHAF